MPSSSSYATPAAAAALLFWMLSTTAASTPARRCELHLCRCHHGKLCDVRREVVPRVPCPRESQRRPQPTASLRPPAAAERTRRRGRHGPGARPLLPPTSPLRPICFDFSAAYSRPLRKGRSGDSSPGVLQLQAQEGKGARRAELHSMAGLWNLDRAAKLKRGGTGALLQSVLQISQRRLPSLLAKLLFFRSGSCGGAGRPLLETGTM